MLLKDYINSKEGFSFVISKCAQYALYYKLNLSDVKSEALFRIASAINNECVVEFPVTYITRVVVNACLTIIKNNKKLSFHYIDEEVNHIELISHPTHDGFELEFINKIDKEIRNKYSDNPEQIKIYEDLVLGDESGPVLAQQLNLSYGAIRVRATRLRDFAKQIYASIL